MSKLPYIHKMKMTRDTTEEFTFYVSGLPDTISAVYFTVKKSINQNVYAFQKTLSNGISVENDIYTVTISPSDTVNLDPGQYVYDLKIIYGANKKRLLTGVFELDRGVTDEEHDVVPVTSGSEGAGNG